MKPKDFDRISRHQSNNRTKYGRMVKVEWQESELLPRHGVEMAEVAVPRTLVAARGDLANSQAFS